MTGFWKPGVLLLPRVILDQADGKVNWICFCQIHTSTMLQSFPQFNVHCIMYVHDDVIKWKHFPRYWPFVLGIHRSPVNSPHKGQWGGALVFSLICAWIHCWVYNHEAGDLRRHRAQYDVIVMCRKRDKEADTEICRIERMKDREHKRAWTWIGQRG